MRGREGNKEQETVEQVEDCIRVIFSPDPNPLFKNPDNLLASINPESAHNQWAPQ